MKGVYLRLRGQWFALAGMALVGLASGLVPQKDEPRPNIVLFLVDDLGWQDSSVSFGRDASPFQARYRTPNLEKLAARGVRFRNAYASAPVCTPTRTAILTGQAPARTHITYWTLNKDQDTSAVNPNVSPPAWALNGLQPSGRETLPHALHSVGYRTIHVGKAHFGAHGTQGADPKTLGFDVNVAGHASGAPGSYWGSQHFTTAGRGGKEPHESKSAWDVPGLDKYHGNDVFLTEALAVEACDAVRSAVSDKVPFYLNFATYAVHMPIMENAKYAAHYPDLDPTERAYATMIETYDTALGALLSTLEETGALDNTVIFFHSDNGGLSAHGRGAAPDGAKQHTHNAPLRSGKGSAYEGGLRVPLVIVWPGITDQPERAGTVIDTPVISHDLFPTILSLTQLQADYGPEIDGRDLTTLLTGREGMFDSNRTLGWNQPHQWGAKGPGIEPFTSIRKGPWKLIYFHADRRMQLFDLSKDLEEANDLARTEPERTLAMAFLMRSWLTQTGAQLSIDRANGHTIEGPVEAAHAWLSR